MTDRFAPGVNQPFYLGSCDTDLGVYCGGTWQGILDNLDYIQGMNFDAIWISPVVAQLPQVTDDGSSYAGYWQQDLFTLNYKFGTLDDLHALIAALHERGMLFMMDVVVNHMAFSGAADNVQYSVMNPFDNESYYHPYCEMDYSGNNITSLENCWLGSWYVPLCDVDTEQPKVQEMFGTWIEQMIANHSVDGLRIDAGANVHPDFFTSFVKSAGVFSTAEVYLSNDTEACRWEETVGSIINYPLYWPLTSAFQSSDGSISDLTKMMESEKSSCKDTTLLTTFSENHDVPRFANHTQDMALAKNVATFVLMSDGIPIIYQGQEQHFTGGTNPFTNREPLWEHGLDMFAPLYGHIATLNTLRKHVMSASNSYTTTQTNVIYQDSNNMVMQKGENGFQVLTILTNVGEENSTASSLSVNDVGYPSGTHLIDVLSCTDYNVGGSGSLTVHIVGGEPLVLYPGASLKDSSLCNMGGNKYFGNANITSQMATTSIYTTTMGSATTTVTAAATIPVLSAVPIADLSATPSASGAASLVSVDTKITLPIVAIALALSSGMVGMVLGFVA